MYDINGTKLGVVDYFQSSIYNTHMYAISGSKIHVFDKREVVSPLFSDIGSYNQDPDAFLFIDRLGKRKKIRYTGTGRASVKSHSTRDLVFD